VAGLRIEQRPDGVAVVLLDRPDRANAFDDETLFTDLPRRLRELAEDDGVRALVVSGAGDAFCAGVDLGSASFNVPDAAATERLVRGAQQAVVTFRTMPQPSIAAVNGVAVGAGFGLAVACDLRIVSPTARFVAPFVRMGMVPDYGSSHNLPRLVGPSAALEILLTGRSVDAEEAVRLGLAARIEDDALAAAIELAATMASAAPQAVRAARRNVYAGLGSTIEEAVLETEPRSVGIAVHSDEFREYFPKYLEELKQRRAARA
jgi:enoyl-CoA hydratase/carnithine racemase